MRLQLIIFLGLGLIAATHNSAFAQSEFEDWQFEVTPRFWYAIVNPNTFSNSSNFQQTNETAEFPLYGVSLRVAPPQLGGADFLLTGFRGETSVKGRSVNSGGTSARHVTDATRTDIELLFRNPIPDTNALWFVGARWVLLEEDSTVGSGLVFPASGTDKLEEETNFYLAEAGMSFSAAIDKAGHHNLFGNFTGGFGWEDQEVTNRTSPASSDHSGWVPIVDVNVGYQYVINSTLNAHVRYRAFALREQVRDEFVAFHGPEIGFSISF